MKKIRIILCHILMIQNISVKTATKEHTIAFDFIIFVCFYADVEIKAHIYSYKQKKTFVILMGFSLSNQRFTIKLRSTLWQYHFSFFE